MENTLKSYLESRLRVAAVERDLIDEGLEAMYERNESGLKLASSRFIRREIMWLARGAKVIEDFHFPKVRPIEPTEIDNAIWGYFTERNFSPTGRDDMFGNMKYVTYHFADDSGTKILVRRWYPNTWEKEKGISIEVSAIKKD